MTNLKVHAFTMHDAAGHSVLKKDWLSWIKEHNGAGNFGVVTNYSWEVDGEKFFISANIGTEMWHELPDKSGFIRFETDRSVDNCCILDVYGKLRYRLTVPWELTNRDVPKGAKMWFRNVGRHIDGQFGVIAWIEYAGDYYFELDYHTGKFLWGKEIRF